MRNSGDGKDHTTIFLQSLQDLIFEGFPVTCLGFLQQFLQFQPSTSFFLIKLLNVSCGGYGGSINGGSPLSLDGLFHGMSYYCLIKMDDF